MATLRLALCQIDVVVGDVQNNVARVVTALREAEDKGADVAVFPELVLSGYPPEDLLHSPSFLAEVTAGVHEVAAQTRDCAAVVGFVESSGALHNAAAIMANAKYYGTWRKELLPNYGVFDEQRFFTPGMGDTPLFSLRGVPFGAVICEDVWSKAGPVERLAQRGARLFLVPNASPYRLGAFEERRGVLEERAHESGCAFAYVNLVGGQDELVFDGASMVLDARGRLVASSPSFVEDILLVDLEVDDAGAVDALEVLGSRTAPLPTAPKATVTARLDADHEVYGALVCATRDYVEKNGFSDVLVALSGGIDSALVASIATDALGAARVHGVGMPSRYSSSGSLLDAEELSKNLGIDFRALPIGAADDAFLSILEPSFADRPADLTEENLQARVRGVLLMALSNKFGWLVLTTGNKSETAVGFSTIYGDTAGGFAVIKDVPKTLVYRLCAMRNADERGPWIPDVILEKPPSAELRLDQRDDDTLPPYAVLDPILEGYVERDLDVGQLVAAGYDEEIVRRVMDLVDHAEYKRRQGPPGPRVTTRGFGKDRRMPITNAFHPSRHSLGRP